MKFDPISKKLFTDDWTFLKRLSCPLRATVYETADLTDADVGQLLERTPGACLAIRADQQNITLTRG